MADSPSRPPTASPAAPRPAPPAAPVVARAASTLVLARPLESGGEPEVLMVQRHGRADFVPGMFVFPGGMVEPQDCSPLAQQLSPSLGAEQAQGLLIAEDGAGPRGLEALGYFVAAIRETFEECGVLLARTAQGAPLPEQAAQARQALQLREAVAAGEPFLPFVARQGWTLLTEELIYFAHWITPEAVPKRFDTRFFLARAPAGAQARVDHTEVVGHRWVTPSEALRQHEVGAMPMIEPTVLNLQLLQTFDSLADAQAGLRRRPVRRVLPKLVRRADGSGEIVLPWDRRFSNL